MRVSAASSAVFVLFTGLFAEVARAGVSVGDRGELTVSLGAGLGWRSNVYRSEIDPIGGLELAVSPRAGLTFKDSDLDLEIEGGYQLRKYLLAGQSNLDRFDTFDVGAVVDGLPDGLIGLQVKDRVALLNNPIDAFQSEDPYSSQLTNDLEAFIPIRPGAPGSALEIAVGGAFGFDEFRVAADAAGDRSYNARSAFGPQLKVDWAFFDRSSFVLEGGYEFTRWRENLVLTGDSAVDLGAFVGVPDSTAYRVRAGLVGRLSRTLSAVIVLGYGDATFDEASVFESANNDGSAETDPGAEGLAAELSGVDSLLVDTQLKLEYGVGQSLVGGYKRDFQSSFFTNFVAYDYAYARATNRLGSALGTGLEFGVRFEEFQGEVARKDIRLLARGNATYFAREWLEVGANVTWNQRASDDVEVEYDDLMVQLGAKLVY